MTTWTGTLPAADAVGGGRITAADIATLIAALAAVTDPWSTYAPVITATGFSLGNGTVTGSYLQAGKLVHAHVEFIVGSTTNLGSTAWSITLPVAASGLGTGAALGVATASLSSGGSRLGGWCYENAATAFALVKEDGTRWAAAVPLAFTTGSEFRCNLTYQCD